MNFSPPIIQTTLQFPRPDRGVCHEVAGLFARENLLGSIGVTASTWGEPLAEATLAGVAAVGSGGGYEPITKEEKFI
jgi:hypothetical protein